MQSHTLLVLGSWQIISCQFAFLFSYDFAASKAVLHTQTNSEVVIRELGETENSQLGCCLKLARCHLSSHCSNPEQDSTGISILLQGGRHVIFSNLLHKWYSWGD